MPLAGQIQLDSRPGVILHDQQHLKSLGYIYICNQVLYSPSLPRFVSWRPDPMAEVTDAFLQDWATFTGYAHPPWCLISRAIFKIQSQMATLVVVVPLWQTQAWFPQLLQMLIDIPILLPQQPWIVEPSPNCDCPMSNLPRLSAGSQDAL